jgi:hypothetical protein
VVLHRVHGHLPALLPELDAPLRQLHHVLELHVGVHHAMRDQQRILEPFREADRRRPPVTLLVVLREVEDPPGVAVVVVRPVGDGAERGTGADVLRRVEQRHQRDEAAVAADSATSGPTGSGGCSMYDDLGM